MVVYDESNQLIYEEDIHIICDEDYPFPPITEDEDTYIPFDADDDYTKQYIRNYVYMNDVIIYSNFEQGFLPVRLTLDTVVVTKGKITFLVEGGTSFCIEDDGIIHNICTDSEKPLPNKYESFLGEKSILKYHFDNITFNGDMSYGWPNKVDSYCTNNIIECIHDGVTTFVVIVEAVRELTFPEK